VLLLPFFNNRKNNQLIVKTIMSDKFWFTAIVFLIYAHVDYLLDKIKPFRLKTFFQRLMNTLFTKIFNYNIHRAKAIFLQKVRIISKTRLIWSHWTISSIINTQIFFVLFITIFTGFCHGPRLENDVVLEDFRHFCIILEINIGHSEFID